MDSTSAYVSERRLTGSILLIGEIERVFGIGWVDADGHAEGRLNGLRELSRADPEIVPPVSSCRRVSEASLQEDRSLAQVVPSELQADRFFERTQPRQLDRDGATEIPMAPLEILHADMEVTKGAPCLDPVRLPSELTPPLALALRLDRHVRVTPCMSLRMIQAWPA
jgi:hypothetical protein